MKQRKSSVPNASELEVTTHEAEDHAMLPRVLKHLEHLSGHLHVLGILVRMPRFAAASKLQLSEGGPPCPQLLETFHVPSTVKIVSSFPP